MANLKEKSNQHLNQNGQGLDGLYRGEVRKQMQDGRVKVFVPGVYDPQFEADGMEDFLPNAEVMQPVWAKSIDQSGCFGLPDVGAIVYVVFLNQDANYPLVIGSCLNAVPGFGKASWNRCMRKKKYVKQLLKNGNAEISLDENGSIDLTVNSMEGAAEDNGSMKDCHIVLDRTNVNNRIILSADDIVLDCRNLLLKSFNTQIDAGNKVIIHGRGGRVAIMSPSIFINSNVGQGTNATVIKGSSGTLVV
jgi:hypothetical protein